MSLIDHVSQVESFVSDDTEAFSHLTFSKVSMHTCSVRVLDCCLVKKFKCQLGTKKVSFFYEGFSDSFV